MRGRSQEFCETPLRRLVTLAVASGVGFVYACALSFGLRTTYSPAQAKLPPVRFAARAAEQSGQSPLNTIAQAGQLPIDVHNAKLRELPALKVHLPKLDLSALQPPQVSVEEPGGSAPSPGEHLSSTQPPPPVPPDNYARLKGRTYPEKPGGPVLVLALLLDEYGSVLNAKIMVPSNHPVDDLTYLMTLPGATVGQPDPPIAKGETRWVELRFRYQSEPLELP